MSVHGRRQDATGGAGQTLETKSGPGTGKGEDAAGGSIRAAPPLAGGLSAYSIAQQPDSPGEEGRRE